jgi:hypothetical protein
MIKEILLYKGKVKIKFDNGTPEKPKHIYKVFDKKGEYHIPVSVTGATGIINKPALIPWAVGLMRDDLLEVLSRAPQELTKERIIQAANLHNQRKKEAADAGSLIHEWVELHIKGMNPAMPEDTNVLNGVLAYLKWSEEHKPKFVASEKIVYSRKFDFVGLLDLQITLGKEKHKILHLADIKTGNGIYYEHLAQTSAYQGADEEESGNKYGSKFILCFARKDGEFRVKESFDQKKDYAAFLGLLAAKKRMDEYRGEK